MMTSWQKNKQRGMSEGVEREESRDGGGSPKFEAEGGLKVSTWIQGRWLLSGQRRSYDLTGEV
jgi:hypothetical protein